MSNTSYQDVLDKINAHNNTDSVSTEEVQDSINQYYEEQDQGMFSATTTPDVPIPDTNSMPWLVLGGVAAVVLWVLS